jgi:hypothetical protein
MPAAISAPPSIQAGLAVGEAIGQPWQPPLPPPLPILPLPQTLQPQPPSLPALPASPVIPARHRGKEGLREARLLASALPMLLPDE